MGEGGKGKSLSTKTGGLQTGHGLNYKRFTICKNTGHIAPQHNNHHFWVVRCPNESLKFPWDLSDWLWILRGVPLSRRCFMYAGLNGQDSSLPEDSVTLSSASQLGDMAFNFCDTRRISNLIDSKVSNSWPRLRISPDSRAGKSPAWRAVLSFPIPSNTGLLWWFEPLRFLVPSLVCRLRLSCLVCRVCRLRLSGLVCRLPPEHAASMSEHSNC